MKLYSCDTCGATFEYDENMMLTWGGDTVTFGEYIRRAQFNKSVKICCDKCIADMPDVFPSDNLFKYTNPILN